MRTKKLTNNHAAAHLLKYAERDPRIPISDEKPNGQMYYPFAEHERFSFWMVDRIRRHRCLSQSSIYLSRNPNDAALSMEELKSMLQNGNIKQLVGRMYAYTSNIVGSDSYWSKKRKELEATMQQKGVGTVFFTFSFADNHWHDLHRQMPSGLLPPKERYKNVPKNSHLADWYFTHKLDLFIKHYFKGKNDINYLYLQYYN